MTAKPQSINLKKSSHKKLEEKCPTQKKKLLNLFRWKMSNLSALHSVIFSEIKKTPQLFQTSLNAHSKKESHLTALRLQDSQMKRIPTFFFSRFLQHSQFFRGGQFPVKLCVCSAKLKKVTELHLKKTAATF